LCDAGQGLTGATEGEHVTSLHSYAHILAAACNEVYYLNCYFLLYLILFLTYGQNEAKILAVLPSSSATAAFLLTPTAVA